MALSSVVQSEDHCLQVVAVNVFLHNRVPGRSEFSLVEISVTLNIGLKLKRVVLCVLHYRKWSIRIGLQSQIFEKSHFIGFVQGLDEVSPELENLFFVLVLLFSLFFDELLFEDSGFWISVNHDNVALGVEEDGLREVNFPVFLKDSVFDDDSIELTAGEDGVFFLELRS